jgi:ABC-type nitrate/sulfonate/bicarbonate transport system substrate-binding protein
VFTLKIKSFWIIFCLFLPADLFAEDLVVINHGGSAAYQAPLWAAKEEGLFEKYGVKAELAGVHGAARQIDDLLRGRAQFSHVVAVGPVAAALNGADVVIVAGAFNKFPWSLAGRKSMDRPADLPGKRIGIAEPGGYVELSLRVALKEWNIPLQKVALVSSGDAAARRDALIANRVDATLLMPPETFYVEKRKLRILAHLGELSPAIPLDLLVARRSYLAQNRAVVKRVLQAYIEAVRLMQSDKQKAMAVYRNMLGEDNPIAQEAIHESLARHFSFPPRVSREGLRLTANLIAEQRGVAKRPADIERLVDESLLDELEREGFFKNLK